MKEIKETDITGSLDIGDELFNCLDGLKPEELIKAIDVIPEYVRKQILHHIECRLIEVKEKE